MKIAVISDIHEDYLCLQKTEKLAAKHKCDIIISLGDVVGYSLPYYNYLNTRNASKCVKWVRDNCKYAVAGNHDLFAIRKIPASNVRNFVFPENWYGLSFFKRQEYAENKIWLYEDNELSALLDEDDIEYLSALPEFISVDLDDKKSFFSHFIYPDISGSSNQFVQSPKDIFEHTLYVKSHNCNISFFGHMHMDGLMRFFDDNFLKSNIPKKYKIAEAEFISVPPITSAAEFNGFIVWDTKENTVELVSLRRGFNFF